MSRQQECFGQVSAAWDIYLNLRCAVEMLCAYSILNEDEQRSLNSALVELRSAFDRLMKALNPEGDKPCGAEHGRAERNTHVVDGVKRLSVVLNTCTRQIEEVVQIHGVDFFWKQVRKQRTAHESYPTESTFAGQSMRSGAKQ